jgi:hydrogenase maturation protease
MRLLLGIGTRFRGDDVAGLRVAEAAGGVAMEAPDAARLLDAWEGVTELVVVDAVRSDAAAGTIHRLDASERPLPAEMFTSDSHNFGLAQAIALGRAMGRLPGRVLVYGIEGKRFGLGDTVSPEVETAIAVLAGELGTP